MVAIAVALAILLSAACALLVAQDRGHKGVYALAEDVIEQLTNLRLESVENESEIRQMYDQLARHVATLKIDNPGLVAEQPVVAVESEPVIDGELGSFIGALEHDAMREEHEHQAKSLLMSGMSGPEILDRFRGITDGQEEADAYLG